MRMYFDDNAVVTVKHGLESWEVKKQCIADYLTGIDNGEKTNGKVKRISTLEGAVVLTHLQSIESIEISTENTIILNPISIKMEVKDGLYNFLISR